MRITTTVALVATVALLAVAIHRVDRESVAAPANVLLRFDAESIKRIIVERGPSKAVLERHDDHQWFFTEPEVDRADPRSVAVLLDQLNHLPVVDTIAPGEEGMRPEQLGVRGDRAIKITLEGDSGAAARDLDIPAVVLGVEAPRSGAIYARREGEEEVRVVDGNPRERVENPLADLRDRRILGVPVAAVEQFALRRAGTEVVVQRRVAEPRQDWALVEPVSAWADADRLDSLLAGLAALEIEEVVPGDGSGARIPDPLPEGAALIQLAVHGLERPITLYLREVEDPGEDGAPLLEATASDRPATYRLRSDFLATLPDSPNALRDRTLARIQMAHLESITIQSRTDPLVYLKAEAMEEGVRWDVSINNRLMRANLSEISELVEAVNEAAILDFTSDEVEDFEPYGLAPPERRVVFNLRYPGAPEPDGSPGAPREIAYVLNFGWKEDDPTRLFARFEGDDSVFELDPGFAARIPTHPMKWRSLGVLNFSPFHLKSITRELGDRERLKLDYDYRRDEWQASLNGVDVSATLDIPAARRLRDRLGSLKARGWYLSLGQAYEALQTPSAEFTIVTTELDPAVNEARETTRTLKLAPSAAGFYFGQLEGSPDVFFIDDDTYRDLIHPVTTGRLRE